jgi:hypothetical protein
VNAPNGDTPRETAIKAAGWYLGGAITDPNSDWFNQLVCDGIIFTTPDLGTELERLNNLPGEASEAAQIGYAVAALLAGYSNRIGLGLTEEDCALFAGAVAAAAERFTRYDDTPCSDCGAPTLSAEPGVRAEYYMVHNEVWAAAGAKPADMVLCIGCLEKRLGRQLTPEDFSEAKLNDLSIANEVRYAWSLRSERLTARLSGLLCPGGTVRCIVATRIAGCAVTARLTGHSRPGREAAARRRHVPSAAWLSDCGTTARSGSIASARCTPKPGRAQDHACPRTVRPVG